MTPGTTSPRVLSILTTRKPSRALWLCVAYLVLLNCLSFIGVTYARSTNHSWLKVDTRMRLQLDSVTDEQQHLMTSEFFAKECEIGHFSKDCSVLESDVVRALRGADPPPLAARLLKDHQYTSPDNLFEEISILGGDKELIALSAFRDLKLNSLVRFAVSWYLNPALAYVHRGREQDALTMYNLFAAVLRPSIKHGNWLSLEGLDATDLPVITDLFCTNQDPLSQSLCIVGFLKAISLLLGEKSIAVDDGDSSSLKATEDLPFAYGDLNPRLRSEKLKLYLNLSLWKGIGAAPQPPIGLDAAQLGAWHYVVGRLLRKAATNLSDVNQCRAIIDRSKAQFRLSLKTSGGGGYFDNPSTRQLEGLTEIGAKACQQ